jgi:anti-sigma B factor antagonist
MQLATEIFGDVVVVHAPDELGTDQADSFESLLVTLERVNVVLDLDGTESIDSRGLTSLVESQDNLRELGGDLRIAATNDVNRKILEITRLDTRLDVFDTVIDAVQSYRSAAT